MNKYYTIKQNIFRLLMALLIPLSAIAQTDVVHNEMIIKFVDSNTHVFNAELTGCDLTKKVNYINAEVWNIPDTLDFAGETIIGAKNIAAFFESFVGVVEYAHPNYLLEATGVPNDTHYDELWAMEKINAPAAWDIQTGSADVTVAVIDSGLDWGHPDLIDNIWQNLGEDLDGDGTVLEWDTTENRWIFDPDDENGIDDDGNGYADDFVGWDFVNNDNDPNDDCFHGTHVAGTIGATGNNGIGVSGVAWNVKLMGLKFLDESSWGCLGYVSDAIAAIEYAVLMGVPISNNSYGGAAEEDIEALESAISIAEQNGHLFIAASGNDGIDTDISSQTSTVPGSYDLDNIITVAATNESDELSVFVNSDGEVMGASNYGETAVDLAAPGSSILSTMPSIDDNDAFYDYKQGISMATSHVTGAAALLLSQCPNLSYQEIKDILLNSVDVISDLDGKCVTGGRLNVGNALNMVVNDCELSGSESVSCLENDSLSLVDLYNSTNGPNWTSLWDLSEPVSTWYGVTLSEDGCRVTSLNLPDNNLIGSIPVELGNLKDLNYLNLGGNELSGSIPDELGNLVNLISINFSNNYLVDCYPTDWCNLNLSIDNIDFSNNPYLPYGGSDQGFLDFCNGLIESCNNCNAASVNLSLEQTCGGEVILSINLIEMTSIVWRFEGEIMDENTETIRVSNFGLYSVDVKDECGNVGIDEIQINETDFCGSPGDYNCDGIVDILDFIHLNSDYQIGILSYEEYENVLEMFWQNYGLTNCNEGPITCNADSINLDSYPDINCGDEVTLFINLAGMTNIVWSFEGEVIGVNVGFITVSNLGLYSVEVTDECGNVGTDEFQLNEISTCVWPGDVNNDNTVNMVDFLAWGLNYGEKGAERLNPSIDWIGQTATDWPNSDINGVNDKHADCDGSGEVDHDDLLAIEQNYGNSYEITTDTTIISTEGSIFLDKNAFSDSSETYIIDIELGDNTIPIHGLTWQIDLGDSLVNNITFEYESDWFGTEGPEVTTYQRYSPDEKVLNIGITRIDGQEITGNGKLGYIVVEEDNVDTWVIANNFDFIIDEAVMVNKVGEKFNFNFSQRPSTGNPNPIAISQLQSTVYPNPVVNKSNIEIELPFDTNVLDIIIYDINGQQIKQIRKGEHKFGKHKFEYNFTQLPKGCYFYKVLTDTEEVTGRFFKFD